MLIPYDRKSNLLTTDEVVDLASLFVGEGVNKIRLTGGEPLVRRDVVEVVSRLKSLDGLETLAMTTNAMVLSRKLPALKEAGLDMINISLDTLVPQKFEFISRRRGHDRVMGAIEDALQAG